MGKSKRSASNRQVDVLQFPFMAILSCIIGALAFILFIFIAHSKDLVDTTQIEKEILGSRDQVELKEKELERLKEQLQEDKKFLVNKEIPEIKDHSDELADLRRRLAELEQEKKRLDLLLARREEPDNERKSELDDLRKKAIMLKASRSVVAEVRHAKSPGLSKPIYIECRENDVVVWPRGTVVAMTQRKLDAASFEGWLSTVGVSFPGKYVIFLIRPSGIATFDALRDLSEKSGLEVGYEPVLDEWELFFS